MGGYSPAWGFNPRLGMGGGFGLYRGHARLGLKPQAIQYPPLRGGPSSPRPSSPTSLPPTGRRGRSVEAVVLVGSVIRRIGQMASSLSRLPIGTTASAKSPSPGRWEGDGRGDRG